MVRGLARAYTLTAACFTGLGVSSCSLLLDWSDYTDGGATPFDAQDDASSADAADATARMDASDATPEHDAGHSDGHAVADAQAAETEPPARCGPTTCGGCCTADGFCAGGSSSATCGVGASPCENCGQIGQSCDHGMCVSSLDAGDAGTPVCTNNVQCATTLCIPVYDSPCCRSDGTCGCQVMFPTMGTCM